MGLYDTYAKCKDCIYCKLTIWGYKCTNEDHVSAAQSAEYRTFGDVEWLGEIHKNDTACGYFEAKDGYVQHYCRECKYFSGTRCEASGMFGNSSIFAKRVDGDDRACEFFKKPWF